MGKAKVTTCDGCGKRTDDMYAELGWIHMESSWGMDVTLTHGRAQDGMARTTFHSAHYDSDTNDYTLDFCSRHCFGDWVWKTKRPAGKE